MYLRDYPVFFTALFKHFASFYHHIYQLFHNKRWSNLGEIASEKLKLTRQPTQLILSIFSLIVHGIVSQEAMVVYAPVIDQTEHISEKRHAGYDQGRRVVGEYFLLLGKLTRRLEFSWSAFSLIVRPLIFHFLII